MKTQPPRTPQSNYSRQFLLKILTLSMSVLLLTSCSNVYNSDDIPSTIKTSDITYKNIGSIDLDVLIAKNPVECRYFEHVAPEYHNYESLSPNSSKTIRYPSNQINTTSILYRRETTGMYVTQTEQALGTISFKVKDGEHYYVLMGFDKKSTILHYTVYTIKNGIKHNVPRVKREREDIDEICTPLTPEQEQLLSE